MMISRLLVLFTLIAACQGHVLAEDVFRGNSRLPKTTPWDLEQLSKAPKFDWADRTGSVHSLHFEGPSYQGKPTRVFAYYASPRTLAIGSTSTGDRYPAVVLIHGGGGTAFREWAELWAKRGYAAIAMDLAGHRPIQGRNAHARANRERLDDGGPNQGDSEKFGSIDKKPSDQWPYHAVANAVLAHSLVRSFPEVDPERTAVTGISWGGYLTCIVAGVDSRFRAAAPVYGCGYLHENSVWLDRFEKMTPEQRRRWIELWDPSRYLPAVTAPILFVNGTNDFAYPLDSYMKSYRAVPGYKQLCVTVNMPHGHQAGWAPKEIGMFIDRYLRKQRGLPELDAPSRKGRQVSVVWSLGPEVKSASLHYTVDDAPINKRKWKTVPASIQNQMAIAQVPKNATVWFFTITDSRGAVVSSEIQIEQSVAK